MTFLRVVVDETRHVVGGGLGAIASEPPSGGDR
jgi:hypothetical protein